MRFLLSPPSLRRAAVLVAAGAALTLGACSKKQTTAEKADAQLVADEAKIRTYLAQNNLTNAVRTASGAWYAMETPGTSAVKPTEKQLVKVDYRFYLMQGDSTDGQLVQSTYISGVPAYLRPINTVKGFRECIQLMSVGETGRMLIPSGLGYGVNGLASTQTSTTSSITLVPANTNLVYYIKLLAVQD